MTPAAPRPIDRQLRQIDSTATAALGKISAKAEARILASATIPAALRAVDAAVSDMELTAHRGRALSAAIVRDGPRSDEYRQYVRALQTRMARLHDPVLASAQLEVEVRDQRLGLGDSAKIRRAVLSIGGRRLSFRERLALKVTDLDRRVQDLRRKRNEEQKKTSDVTEAVFSEGQNKSHIKELLVVLMVCGSITGFSVWHIGNRNEVRAIQKIELQSGKTIPAGSKGTRSDTPCKLIDKTVGVSVLFQRDGNTPVETCVRESMITR